MEARITEARITEASEVQTATVVRVVTTASEVQMEMEALADQTEI